MSSQQPIASVFNDAYAAEQFEAYRRDPASVEESWRQFFRFAEQAMGGYVPPAAPSASCNCAAVLAPMIGAVTAGLCSIQARAI